MSSPPFVPTMVPKPALTVSKKDSKETIDYTTPIKKFLIFGSGASITETAFTTRDYNKRKIGKEYIDRIRAFLFDDVDNLSCFGPLPPGCSEMHTIEHLMKDSCGKKVYRAFIALKAQFRKMWTKQVVFKSGENVDDMVDRVCREVWVERRNAELKRKNQIPDATVSDCPAGFVPLERATFKEFWDHPILKRGKPYDEKDDTPFAVEDSICAQVMTRTEQRQLKKQKTAHGNNNDNNEFFTERLEIARIHAASTKNQAAQMEKQAAQLRIQNKMQLAEMVQTTNPALYATLMEELAASLTDNNNNNSNNSDSDN